jgi:FkbM family methyltransferase
LLTEYNMTIYFQNTNYGTFCLLEKDLISNFIKNYGVWESHLYYFYSNFIKPDYIILDGGANLGFHTVCFATLANQGEVYSFEPQPLVFNILSTNILLNGATDIVKQFKLGLGDKKEILKMTPLNEQVFSEDCINWGGRGLTSSEKGEEEVTLTTIDELNLSKLDMIKLDVQGFEYETFKGGEKTIKNNYPIIFLENYLDQPKDQLVIKMLQDWGYINYRLKISHNEDCILLFPSKHSSEIDFIETQTQLQWIK